jgi:hypothetical protein
MSNQDDKAIFITGSSSGLCRDGKDQIRYIAGADAKAMYAMRLQLGDEAFRKAIAQQFFGDAAKAA